MLLNILIAVIVLGFCYWIWTLIEPLILQFVGGVFGQILHVIALIVFAGAALFYILIPLLRWGFQQMPHIGLG